MNNHPKRLLSVKATADRRLLSVEEAAVYLGLSPRTLYNGVAPKSKDPFPVKAKRLGKRVLFDIHELDRFVDSLGPGAEKEEF